MHICEIHTMIFGIHTIEFTLSLDVSDYNEIKKTIYQSHSKTFSAPIKNGIIIESKMLQHSGVRVILKHSQSEEEYLYWALTLVVNPRILIGDTTYIGIYDCAPDSNDLLIKKLNDCIQRLGLSQYYNKKFDRRFKCTIQEFTISRLDLCTNLKFETTEIAEIYLKLLRRGNRYRFLREDTHYDPISKRNRTYRDALLLHAGSFDISVYNKYRQMEDNIKYFKVIPPEAEGVLRFEMQLRPIKLRYILQKRPGINLGELLCYAQDLCRKEWERYAKALFYSGDYYTLNDACTIIHEQETATQAAKKIQFLKAVSENKSLYQTIREYKRNGWSCRYMLEGLERLGVNPVTIPERWLGKHARLASIPACFGFCGPRADLPRQELPAC